MNSKNLSSVATLALLLFVAVFVGTGCTGAGQEVPADLDADGVEQQLQQLRTAIESEPPENYADLAPQVNELRQALEVAYQEGDMAESWQELEPQFETLEQQLRNQSGDAQATLDAIIEQMRADLQQQ